MPESHGDKVQDLRRQIGAELEAAEDDSARAAWHARWDQQDYRRSLCTTAEADHPATESPERQERSGMGWISTARDARQQAAAGRREVTARQAAAPQLDADWERALAAHDSEIERHPDAALNEIERRDTLSPDASAWWRRRGGVPCDPWAAAREPAGRRDSEARS
jgi:hypothetical protein